MFNVVLTCFLAAIFRERVSCQAHMLLKKIFFTDILESWYAQVFFISVCTKHFYFNASKKFTHHVQQTYTLYLFFYIRWYVCILFFKSFLLKINDSKYKLVFFPILYLPEENQKTRLSFCAFKDCLHK